MEEGVLKEKVEEEEEVRIRQLENSGILEGY